MGGRFILMGFWCIPVYLMRYKKKCGEILRYASLKWFSWMVLAFIVPVAYAQNYPVKPIRIISPYTAGGLGDLVQRAIGGGLTEALGQQILVENRPGASQAIGCGS